MLFDIIDYDIIYAIFTAVFVVLFALNMFVYPKKFFFNSKILGKPDLMAKENELANGGIARIFTVDDEKSSEFISKSVVMTKGIDCYLRAILVKEVTSIAYEVTMFDTKDGEYLPFKTITIKQAKIEGGELDLIRLSERTKAVKVRVVMVDGKKIAKQQVSKKQVNSYAFVSSLTIIPLAIVAACVFTEMFYNDGSSFMVLWNQYYRDVASIGAIVLPILAYFACVGITIGTTRASFRPKLAIKRKGDKKNG